MALVPFSYNLRETTLVVIGYLDERAHFPDTADIEAVNMAAITGFSSLGLRQFFALLYGQQSDLVRLLECPVDFIEAVNALSGLIKGSKITIDSLLMPCRCENCLLDVEVLVHRKEVQYDQNDVTIPPQLCHRCRQALTVMIDPWEYFLFLFY